MAYIVLARKYRPKRFSEILGQEHITTTLTNAILEDKISHGYIFSGQRGTGKTTTARVLAKSLNCLSTSSPTPSACDVCTNCQEINEGISMDVIEIDAASNRGINEIRTLRENVRYAPANSRYKVYIIDEAHQITDEAFNALLKTLEEPPKHTLFILATTQPQKIPLTIISRCQHFRFRPIPFEIIFDGLKKILKIEKYNVDDEALKLIVSLANGSFRDALGLLDQVTSYKSGPVNAQDIKKLLGLTPKELLETLLETIVTNNTKGIFEISQRIFSEGYDFIQITKDLKDIFRYLLLSAYGIEIENPMYEDMIKKYSFKFKDDAIIKNIQILENCLINLKYTDHQKLSFEMHMAKLSSELVNIPELIEKLEKLEKIVSGKAIQPKIEEVKEIDETKEIKEEKPIDWEKIKQEIKNKKPLIGSYLDFASPEFNDNILKLSFPLPFYIDVLSPSTKELEKIISDSINKEIKITFQLTKQTMIFEEAEEEQEEEIVIEDFNAIEEKPGTTEEDELIKKIVKKFGGKVVSY